MTRFLLLSMALFIGTTNFAQQAERVGSIGIRTGLSTYYGELNTKFFPASKESAELFDNLDYASWSVDYETYLGNAWGIGVSYTNAEFSATDRSVDWSGNLLREEENFNRSLNVNTKIQQASLYGLWSGNDGKLFRENAFFSPFAKVGIGVAKFDPRGDLRSANGNPYLYQNGEVFEVFGTDAIGPSRLDNSYETELRPLNTEGDSYGKYSLTALGGLGFNFRFSDKFSMQLGTDVRYAFTDNLDNVSGPFQRFAEPNRNQANNPAGYDLGATRGESGNDWYAFTYLGARFYFGNRADQFKSPVVILGGLPLGDTAATGQRLFTFDPPKPLTPLEISPLPQSRNPAASMTVPSVSMLPPAPQWKDTDGGEEVPSIEDEGVIDFTSEFDDSYAEEELNANEVDTLNVDNTSRPPQIVSTYPDWANDENYKISDSLSLAIQNLDIQLASSKFKAVSQAELDSLDRVAFAKTSRIDSLRTALEAMKHTVRKDSVVIRETDTVTVERILKKPTEDQDQAAARKLEAELARLNQEVTDNETYRKRLIEQEENRVKLLEARDRQLANEAKRDDQTQRKYDRGLLKNNAAETAAILKMTSDQAALRAEVAQLSAQIASMATALQSDTSRSLVIPERQAAPIIQTPTSPTDPALLVELNALRAELSALRKSLVIRSTSSSPVVVAPTTPTTPTTPTAPQISAPATRDVESDILSLLSQYGSTQVFFETGKAALSTAALNGLAGLANGAKGYPDRVLVTLAGFTDRTGSLAANQALSQRRVESVKNALIDMGVSSSQLRTSAIGPDLNASDLAMARRVEVSLKVQ